MRRSVSNVNPCLAPGLNIPTSMSISQKLQGANVTGIPVTFGTRLAEDDVSVTL